MFGSTKKIEAYVKEEYRLRALQYFDNQLNKYEGSGAYAFFSGAVEFAEALGLISYEEAKQICENGHKRYSVILEERKKQYDIEVAQRKAERAAKAKAAKEEK